MNEKNYKLISVLTVLIFFITVVFLCYTKIQNSILNEKKIKYSRIQEGFSLEKEQKEKSDFSFH